MALLFKFFGITSSDLYQIDFDAKNFFAMSHLSKVCTSTKYVKVISLVKSNQFTFENKMSLIAFKMIAVSSIDEKWRLAKRIRMQTIYVVLPY